MLLALDGLRFGAGTYTHEQFGEADTLYPLAHDLAVDLATLGKQGDAVLEKKEVA
jgi:hypothetical protein